MYVYVYVHSISQGSIAIPFYSLALLSTLLLNTFVFTRQKKRTDNERKKSLR